MPFFLLFHLLLVSVCREEPPWSDKDDECDDGTWHECPNPVRRSRLVRRPGQSMFSCELVSRAADLTDGEITTTLGFGWGHDGLEGGKT